MSRKRLRMGLFLLVGLGAVVIEVALYFAPRWKPLHDVLSSSTTLENKSIDARFQIRGTHKAPKDLVVVGIDDVTFGDLQQRWPFRRNIHAAVIDRLHKDGAKVIVFDVQFSEPEGPANYQIEDDTELLLAC